MDIRSLAISPEGRWVAASGASPRRLPASGHGWTRFAFDLRGRGLVVRGVDRITRWRPGEWTEDLTVPFPKPLLHTIAFSPDGEILETEGGHDVVHLLRSAELTLIAELPKPTREVWELRLSPDGNILAMSAAENGVYTWDLRTLRIKLAEMELDW